MLRRRFLAVVLSISASALAACGAPPLPGTWTIATSTGKVDNVFDGDGNAPASTTTEQDEVEDAGALALLEDGTGTITLTKLWTGITSADFAELEAGQEQTGPLEWVHSTFDGETLALITEVAVDDMNQQWTVTGSSYDSLDVLYNRTDDFSPTQRAITTRTMHLVKTGD